MNAVLKIVHGGALVLGYRFRSMVPLQKVLQTG